MILYSYSHIVTNHTLMISRGKYHTKQIKGYAPGLDVQLFEVGPYHYYLR